MGSFTSKLVKCMGNIMELNELKDTIFELINSSDLPIQDIDTDDRNNIMKITTLNGNKFILNINKVD